MMVNLFDEIEVVVVWGSDLTRRGGRIMQIPCKSNQEASFVVEQLVRRRIRRGYVRA
jgi:hypothetical protein